MKKYLAQPGLNTSGTSSLPAVIHMAGVGGSVTEGPSQRLTDFLTDSTGVYCELKG